MLLPEARRLALHHSLYRFRSSGKPAVLDAIRSLRYVQIDTISVVERAHHHTLYNRVPDYDPIWLDELLATDKAIWEYWGHAASYLPIEDFRFYLHRMQRFPVNSWDKANWEKHKELAPLILQRIHDEGALSSSDFDDKAFKRTGNGWGDWKPAKYVLELLMWKGDLMVTSRRGFQRVYDLTSRVLPSWVNTIPPTQAELARYMILTTLEAHGIASEWDIMHHITLTNQPTVQAEISALVKSDVIRPITIEGLKEAYYTLTALDVPGLLHTPATPTVYLLSPFDNACILRPRLSRLFNFDYSIECYVTPAKRKYGYWSLPILYKDTFVGRLDPKADRANKHLIINSIHISSPIWQSRAFQTALHKELMRFAAFNKCDKYTISNLNLL